LVCDELCFDVDELCFDVDVVRVLLPVWGLVVCWRLRFSSLDYSLLICFLLYYSLLDYALDSFLGYLHVADFDWVYDLAFDLRQSQKQHVWFFA
jgi:hypothetical protein